MPSVKFKKNPIMIMLKNFRKLIGKPYSRWSFTLGTWVPVVRLYPSISNGTKSFMMSSCSSIRLRGNLTSRFIPSILITRMKIKALLLKISPFTINSFYPSLRKSLSLCPSSKRNSIILLQLKIISFKRPIKYREIKRKMESIKILKTDPFNHCMSF